MRYSVYNYDRRQYDYYEAPGPGGTHAGSPPRRTDPAGRVATREMGASPETATWRLPDGAIKIGSGEMPEGRIASLGSVDLGSTGSVLAVLAVAVIAWKVLS